MKPYWSITGALAALRCQPEPMTQTCDFCEMTAPRGEPIRHRLDCVWAVAQPSA